MDASEFIPRWHGWGFKKGVKNMATIASTEKVVCPYCGATGVVRIWSCGCQGVSHNEHKKNCSRPGAFFDDFWRDCGKSGNVRDH